MLSFKTEIDLFQERAKIKAFPKDGIYHFAKLCKGENNSQEELVSFLLFKDNMCLTCKQNGKNASSSYDAISEVSSRLEELLNYYANVEVNSLSVATSLLKVLNSKHEVWPESTTKEAKEYDMLAYMIIVKQIDSLLYDKVNAYFEKGYASTLFTALNKIYETEPSSSKVKITEGNYLLFSQEVTGSYLFSNEKEQENLDVVFDYYYGTSKNNFKILPYEMARFIPEEFENVLKLVPKNCNETEFIETFEILFRDTPDKSLKTFEEVFQITTNLMSV